MNLICRVFYRKNNKAIRQKNFTYLYVLLAVFPCVAAASVNTDAAWGSPALPPDSFPSSDPFGDGSKKDDPWGAPSSAPSNGTGKLMFTLCLNAYFCDPSMIHESKTSLSALNTAIKCSALIKSTKSCYK